jgi:gliding motility-associated-like protein
VGDGDGSKINGYATVAGQEGFIFPVGDAAQLRPLILRSEGVNTLARCAYFPEDPNNPSAFSPFNTALKPRNIGSVSTVEFWRLEGSVPSTITLSWNSSSNMGAIATDVSQVVLMGWSKRDESWLLLGNESVAGDLEMGMVSSVPFTPDDYAAITFGSLAEATDILTLSNYLITPNGDGQNDVLIIPELDLSPNNSLRIFDRTGLKVFEMVNYTDEFTGVSNLNNLVINRDAGLPEGVYFYLVTLDDLGYEYQGFLYLDR